MDLFAQRGNFKVFAFELGGTWVDSRNPSTWTQAKAAAFLNNLGYSLFLRGAKGLLPVDAAFFNASRVEQLKENGKHLVQGNCLAVHKSVLKK